jgi:hypothetical protein
MDIKNLIEQMERSADCIRAFVEGVSPEQAQWKPDPNTWSIQEAINHLADEEREDFRLRLEIILNHPQDPWPTLDQRGWETPRTYHETEAGLSMQEFLAERSASLEWLRSLSSPDWQAQYPAPWGGTITAGDMLAAWAAHDLLHLRQLLELNRAYLIRLAAPFKVDYAGPWE